jgi:NADH-quinone oxidoreductase subunit M
MTGLPSLSILVALPLLFGVATLLLPKGNDRAVKVLGIVGTSAVFLWTVMIGAAYYSTGGGMQFVELHPWVPVIGMTYHLGIDGLSLPLVFLAALLTLLCAVYSWRLNEQVKTFFFLLFLLQVGMIGVFLALDGIMFYVFWEIVLVPMFFMIGIWGGERRRYASVKFFIYTLIGSVVMLLGLMLLYVWGPKTFDLVEIAKWGQAGKFTNEHQLWIYGCLFLGFAVKVPIFPFHTWLPDAHVEAPTVGSVLLAGVLLKMGGYGFLRVSLPALPYAFKYFSFGLGLLGVIGIVYGAAVALTQKDLKKMVAYSSVSHMGFVVLGIASATVAGIDGAVMQMFNHGIITGMLFFLVGMIYERYHTKEIARLRGIVTTIPALGVIVAFASFASLGLPGLAGFVGEFMTLFGGYQAFGWMAAFAVVGIVLTAAYFLRMLQQCVFSPVTEDSATCGELCRLTVPEFLPLVPLMGFALFLGLYPQPFLAIINPAATALAAIIGR